MKPEELQAKIRERWQLQGERNKLLDKFAGMDPQKMNDPMQLMGLLPELPNMKQAYELTQKIEALSDEIIKGFIGLNMGGET